MTECNLMADHIKGLDKSEQHAIGRGLTRKKNGLVIEGI